MRSLLALAALLAATILPMAVVVALAAVTLAPVQLASEEEPEQETSEEASGEGDELCGDERGGDQIDRDGRWRPLDDDLLHTHSELHSAFETITWSSEAFHAHPEGRTPTRSKRPPRAS